MGGETEAELAAAHWHEQVTVCLLCDLLCGANLTIVHSILYRAGCVTIVIMQCTHVYLPFCVNMLHACTAYTPWQGKLQCRRAGGLQVRQGDPSGLVVGLQQSGDDAVVTGGSVLHVRQTNSCSGTLETNS